MNRRTIVNWWANYAEIPIPSTSCPVSPNGELQSAPAFVLEADWLSLFNTAFWTTAGVALVLVFLTYYTRRMGARFTPRWWLGLLSTALIAGIATYFIVTGPLVNTFGCQYGDIRTHIPTAPALSRSLVAATQAPIWFLFWSFLLTRVVRVGRWQPFHNNSRFPF